MLLPGLVPGKVPTREHSPLHAPLKLDSGPRKVLPASRLGLHLDAWSLAVRPSAARGSQRHIIMDEILCSPPRYCVRHEYGCRTPPASCTAGAAARGPQPTRTRRRGRRTAVLSACAAPRALGRARPAPWPVIPFAGPRPPGLSYFRGTPPCPSHPAKAPPPVRRTSQGPGVWAEHRRPR